jgi:hypothetical protein
MEKRRMPLYLINWVKAFTSNRTHSFSFDGQIETPKHFKCGLPQGSSVSPILFLIVANIIIEPPTPSPDPTVSYIDDIGMIESGTNYIETMEKLKIWTKEQLNRAEAVGLKFAADKSELIHCAAKGTHHDLSQEDIFPALVIDNANEFEIRPSKQIKQLGVIIDSTLSFKQHAIQAASAMKCRLGALHFLRNTNIGISAYIANHLALTTILPKLFWASPVWWDNTKAVLDPIAKAYNSLARWITGLPISTRISNILNCAHHPPLNVYLDYLTKDGATNQDTVCAHTFSSKAWLFATTRAQFNRNWEKEIPQAHYNLTFPSHIQLLKWNDTREIFKTFCNRTPNDPCHPQEPEPCPCGEGFMSGHHLFIHYRLLATERLKMTTKNGLEIESNLYTSMNDVKRDRINK